MIKKILSLLARWKNTALSASIKFPYQHKIIDFGEIPDPLVKLQIKTKGDFYLTIKFLVDSGADATTLPLTPYGKLVGFKPNKEEKITIGGVEGKGVEGYPGEIEIKVGRRKLQIRCYFIETQIMPLLGRCDFWNKFSIYFDNQEERIIFKPID